MIVKEIAYGSTEHRLSLALRRRVLREPLGLVYQQADLDREWSEIFIVALALREVVGTLQLKRLGGGEMKMRQVAVAPESQGKGIGRRLVQAAEEWCKDNGMVRICLAARDSAVPFYERMGYEATGEPFMEVTLPHRLMRKKL